MTINITFRDYIMLEDLGFVSVTLPLAQVANESVNNVAEVVSHNVGSAMPITCRINCIARSERTGVPAGMAVVGLSRMVGRAQ